MDALNRHARLVLVLQRGLDVIACVWVAQVLLDLGARLSLGRYSPKNHGESRPHPIHNPHCRARRSSGGGQRDGRRAQVGGRSCSDRHAK